MLLKLPVILPVLAVVLRAAPIVVAPPGLNPGDHYRLVFVTLNSRDATSSNIDDYNQFVSQAANSVAVLQALGATWTAIASTATVSALTNIGNSSFPIYRLDGLLVANNTADLFDGSINNAINITNTGASVLGGNAWTGTASNGSIGLPLGAATGFVTTGRLAGQTVTIHQHLDGTVSIRYGPHVVGRGKDAAVENHTPVSHRSLDPKRTHFPTASTTMNPLSPKPKAKRVA